MYRLLLIVISTLFCLLLQAKTPIFGLPEVEPQQMYDYVARHNPAFDKEIAQSFYDVGKKYGIRGDIALCQAIIETGWFRFDNGTAVGADAHNYCGLGVMNRGATGCSFATVEEGVTAMLQHLFAYAGAEPLPEGEIVVDPRFKYVSRGCAPTWEKLSGRWAMNPNYGANILRIYGDMLNFTSSSGAKRLTTPTVTANPFDLSDENFGNINEPHDVNQKMVEVTDYEIFK